MAPSPFAVAALLCLVAFGTTSSQRPRNAYGSAEPDQYDDSYDDDDDDSYEPDEPMERSYDPYRRRASRPPSRVPTNEIDLLHLDEGDVCRRSFVPTEPDFVCRNVKRCVGPVTEAVQNGRYLDVCSFDGTQLVVCCPSIKPAIVVPNIDYRPTPKPTPAVPVPPTRWTTRPTAKWTTTPAVPVPPTRWTTRPTAKWTTTTTTKKPPARPVTRPQTVRPTTAAVPSTTAVPADKRFQNVAAQKCRQYNQLLPKSYYASDAVGDGTETKPLEFPHMALVGYGETTESRDDWRCGGSLVSERWILTAANCMYRSGSLARWVRLGDFDVESTMDFAQPVDYRIARHEPHPDYERSERYNDIALFRLDADVEFSAFARPICLNSDPSLSPSPQTVTGWGATSTDGGSSDKLQKVTLDIVPTNRCNASYYPNDDPKLKFGITPDSMICGAATTEDEDACQGFSGGPLQARDSQTNTLTYVQFGITSFGSSFCGVKENPGVYTRVAKYISWIEKTIW